LQSDSEHPEPEGNAGPPTGLPVPSLSIHEMIGHNSAGFYGPKMKLWQSGDGLEDRAAQLAFAPEAFTTSAHLLRSPAMKAVN
jgi:hypothetical protein